MRAWLGVSAVLLTVSMSLAVGAVERQWHVGAGLGAATFEGSSGLAPGAGAYGAYGISDVFDVRLELTAVTFDFTESPAPSNRTQVYSALAGLVYKVDIIEWVPYLGLLLGYARFSGGPAPPERAKDELAFEANAGLDYFLTRHIGLGAKVGYQGFLLSPPESLTDTPSFVFMLRAEHCWGW